MDTIITHFELRNEQGLMVWKDAKVERTPQGTVLVEGEPVQSIVIGEKAGLPWYLVRINDQYCCHVTDWLHCKHKMGMRTDNLYLEPMVVSPSLTPKRVTLFCVEIDDTAVQQTGTNALIERLPDGTVTINDEPIATIAIGKKANLPWFVVCVNGAYLFHVNDWLRGKDLLGLSTDNLYLHE